MSFAEDVLKKPAAQAGDAVLEIVSPVADPKQDTDLMERFDAAPRLKTFAGKTIGLFWNGKAHGNIALDRVKANLAQRYPDARFIDYLGVNGPQLRRATPAQLDQIAAECDAVVGTSADCGSCCSWLIHEMCELERRGRPTVAITSSGFVEDAHWSAKVFSCPDAQIMEIARPLTCQTEAEIHEMIDGAMDQLLMALTVEPKKGSGDFDHHVTSLTAAVLKYHGANLLDCFDVMNSTFVAQGWSDGLPLVPPTPEKVRRMVEASGRAAQDVVACFEPGFGVGTVEKLAANAVMAGCAPEAMPVVLAVAEALMVKRFGLRCLAMSTGPQSPLILVSGPYADAIGMNSGCCALGPGSMSQVNIAIGRACRLIMMNVGLSYPEVSDMDTIGNTGKFSQCVAENEGKTPWEPFRVSKGFSADSTTVTLHAPYAVSDVTDFHNTTPEAIVETFCLAARNCAVSGAGVWLVNGGGDGPEIDGPFHGDWDPVIMMAPEHARIFETAGWSRSRMQEAFFEGAKAPFKDIMHTKSPENFVATHPELQWLWANPEAKVSLYRRPDQIDIFVVGKEAPRSLFWYGGTTAVTREVIVP